MSSLHDELEKQLLDSNAAPMSFPLQFLKAITCDFSTESELGRGGYGVVYKGVLPSGKIIAVKKLFEIHLVDDKTFQNEVSSLMNIKHQHVVRFMGYCAESSWETIQQPSGKFIWAEMPKRLLCFEYLCNESLDKYISDKSLVLEWNMRYEIIKGICNGLNFLHEECCMVHLDLKPENILMDATMIPKIADFGLSRIFGNQQSRILTNNSVGSRGYMAPEYLIQGIISMKADIFSLGVLIIEIITGRRDYPYLQLDSPQNTATSCQQFTEEVLASWRYKFESTMKNIRIEKYIQQVKQCITIALKCVDPSMERRPRAKDVIQVLNAVDQMKVSKQMPSEMESKDRSLVLDTNLSKELILHSITKDISNIKTSGTVGSSASNQNDNEVPQAFNEPQSAPDKTTDSEVIPFPGSSVLLDIYPLELIFHFEPNKLIACSLDLTNNTDEQVAFRLVKKRPEQTCFLRDLPLFGIVDPGAIYTLALIMDKQDDLPKERNVDLILETTIYSGILSEGECIQHFQNAEDSGNTVQKVTLKSGCALRGEMIFESIPPSIKILSIEGNMYGSNISCMDANQTEQLIIIGHFSRNVRIWNYDTQKSMGSIELPARETAWCVRFIARKGWCLVGSNDGFIHVYDYKKEMKKTADFKADKHRVDSLAIHPTQPYVLSSGREGIIKLWDWDHGWTHMQTFNEHSDIVLAVAFNPEDHNSFASASDDLTIKVWSLDSPYSKYTLSGHSDWVTSLDFFTCDGQQYLITGSDDKTAKIWDMEKKQCVRTLPHRSAVWRVLPHPKLPLLVTGTQDHGDVYVWSSTSFRLKRKLSIGGSSWVKDLACLNESGRVPVAHREGVSVIEIPDEEEGGSSSNNSRSAIDLGNPKPPC